MILIIIDNYIIYSKQVFFRVRQVDYILSKFYKSKFCI